MQDDSVLKLAEDISYQEMSPGGQTVILSLASGYLFTCNDTTRSFLEALDGQRSFAEVLNRLIGRYEVEPERLRQDIAKLAEKMLDLGLIVRT